MEERQYNLLQEVDADLPQESVTEQIGKVIENILDNKQCEKESMREMFVIKLKQRLAEKAKHEAQDAAEGMDEQDRSIDAEELNRTGTMSKMSQKNETGRNSKEQAAADVSLEQINKSGLSNAVSM